MFRSNTLSNLLDEELLLAYQEANRNIYIDKNIYMRELFTRYLHLIYGVCLKYLKDSDKAMGAVMQLFEELLYGKADEEIDVFRPWIYNVVKIHCLQILRKEAYSVAVDCDNMHLLEEDQDEQRPLLRGHANRSYEQQQECINYFFIYKLSYAEIVNKTGYPLKDVKNYIKKGKQNLKIHIANNDPMNLWEYIKGDRSGIKAHGLEEEAMFDPFLQDTIEGYDINDNMPTYHLKRLNKHIKKRTRQNLQYAQLWSIGIGALLIICLSIFFFALDSNNINDFPKKTGYAKNFPNNSLALNHILDSLATLELLQTATDTTSIPNNNVKVKEKNQSPDLIAVKENLTNQQGKRKNARQDESIDADELYSEFNNYTLSNGEIKKFLSEYYADYTKNDRTPKPTIGDKAYHDYIKKNKNSSVNLASEKQHGKVILLFNVDEKGRPIDISILRSLNQSADREAIRLLQNGPNWTVGDKRVHFEIEF